MGRQPKLREYLNLLTILKAFRNLQHFSFYIDRRPSEDLSPTPTSIPVKTSKLLRLLRDCRRCISLQSRIKMLRSIMSTSYRAWKSGPIATPRLTFSSNYRSTKVIFCRAKRTRQAISVRGRNGTLRWTRLEVRMCIQQLLLILNIFPHCDQNRN